MEVIITFTARITNFPPFKNLTWELKPGVNFLVGPNGVGKTRLIDSIKEGKLQLKTNTETRIPGSAHRRQQHNSDTTYQYNDWGGFEYDDLKEANQDYLNINNNFELCGQPGLDEKEIRKSKQSTRNDKGRRVQTFSVESAIQLHGVEFNSTDMLSKGTKFLYEKLLWKAPRQGMKPLRFKGGTAGNYFIFLEEPENSLHPDVQKKVPAQLVEWYKKQDRQIIRNLFVIVTTHSPFILKEMDVKDTSFLSCCVMKRDSTELKSLNYDQVIAEGNHLLGVGIGDLLPGRIILAENSIVKLIETIAQNLSMALPAFFVTSGGDGDTDNRIKNIQALQKMLKSMSKNYPERFLLNMSYVVIFDDEAKKKEGEQG